MIAKFIEIRDEATCILALAIKMQEDGEDPETAAIEHWFLHRRSGYPEDGSSIMLMRLSDGKATNDPYEWPALGMGRRTMGNAHNYIIDHFEELKTGDVVDVSVILGESTTTKISERVAHA